MRAIIRSRLAIVLGRMGTANAADADRHIAMSFDLHHQARDDEPSPWLADYFAYSCAPGADAELASEAAASYVALARRDARFAVQAQRYARQARDRRHEGFTRSRVFDQVTLARAGFRAGELDQACRDGQEAITMAAAVSDSQRVPARLTQLMDDTVEHQRVPAVRELREELRIAVAAAG